MDSRIRKPHYISYLVRLWRDADSRGAVWQASAEHPMTGQRIHFTSPAALFDFLDSLTRTSEEPREEE